MQTDPTQAQRELMWHTLGLRPDRRDCSRNHYVAGPGHYAMPDLEALEAIGYMERGRAPSFIEKSDVVFHVTTRGRMAAIDLLPPPPKRTRYSEYLDADYGHSFAEWLCIEVPEVEFSGYTSYYGIPAQHYRYRRREFRRGDRWSPEVKGEWKPTKKEAKASYKAALKEMNDRMKRYAAEAIE